MFSHESRVFSRESRENLRELKGASVLRIKISIYIKYGSEPLLLIIYASYCALSVNAGSPGCPFNQNALLKGHLKGTFLFKKGQKEGKKGQIYFFKAVLQNKSHCMKLQNMF